ncbi:MAG TPA: hypothetical protein EYP56_02540 [Planctomycetaceae bacterium]|nr:hypothetical protein [Planctomycetaceae bacterium]HIQ22704.1 hypothetical protein [Planctomycetota bacterium]
MCAEEHACCPPFDPAPWGDKELVWEGKRFVQDRVRSFFHIPLNFGSVVRRNQAMIDEAGAGVQRPLMLCDENSLWGADLYFEVTKDVPNARMATLTGTFLTKVFEGPYRQVGQWMTEMQDYVRARGKTLEKLYCYYTTCPKCAGKYGKNYVVLVAQVGGKT